VEINYDLTAKLTSDGNKLGSHRTGKVEQAMVEEENWKK
jgi:hypothetical protein